MKKQSQAGIAEPLRIGMAGPLARRAGLADADRFMLIFDRIGIDAHF